MKSAELAAEELNEQVSHRLMELDHESRVLGHDTEVDEVIPDVHIYDNVLSDPTAYRELALAHAFQTFEVGGVQWHGRCGPTSLRRCLSCVRVLKVKKSPSTSIQT